jgi:hypothetical protein
MSKQLSKQLKEHQTLSDGYEGTKSSRVNFNKFRHHTVKWMMEMMFSEEPLVSICATTVPLSPQGAQKRKADYPIYKLEDMEEGTEFLLFDSQVPNASSPRFVALSVNSYIVDHHLLMSEERPWMAPEIESPEHEEAPYTGLVYHHEVAGKWMVGAGQVRKPTKRERHEYMYPKVHLMAKLMWREHVESYIDRGMHFYSYDFESNTMRIIQRQ